MRECGSLDPILITEIVLDRTVVEQPQDYTDLTMVNTGHTLLPLIRFSMGQSSGLGKHNTYQEMSYVRLSGERLSFFYES
jgi:hypothetical protein